MYSELSAHTPDNSFLGFVVGSNKKNTTAIRKKNIGLVYGKELYMWQVRVTSWTKCPEDTIQHTLGLLTNILNKKEASIQSLFVVCPWVVHTPCSV